jgi:hypothetical protein
MDVTCIVVAVCVVLVIGLRLGLRHYFPPDTKSPAHCEAVVQRWTASASHFGHENNSMVRIMQVIRPHLAVASSRPSAPLRTIGALGNPETRPASERGCRHTG